MRIPARALMRRVADADVRDKRLAARLTYLVAFGVSVTLHSFATTAALALVGVIVVTVTVAEWYDRADQMSYGLWVFASQDRLRLTRTEYAFLERWAGHSLPEGHARYDSNLMYRWFRNGLPGSLLVSFISRGISQADLWAYAKARRGSDVREGIELVAALTEPLEPSTEAA